MCWIAKSPVFTGFFEPILEWRRIEVVITGRTRNAFALRGTRVRIPPSPLYI